MFSPFTPDWVQWYDLTGTSGGSLWILLLNVLLYDAFYGCRKQKGRLKELLAAAALIALPLPVFGIVQPAEEKAQQRLRLPKNVIIVQPNIDPYDEKVRRTNGSFPNESPGLAL